MKNLSLYCILMDSFDTPGLYASFDEPSLCLCRVSLLGKYLSANSELQLDPGIKFHKLWCQASALLLPVSLVGKLLAS